MGYRLAIEPHGVLVIGQDQFQEPARGIVWDCRGFGFGLPAVPMDLAASPNSNLNTDFIESNLANWPDQELVGMLDVASRENFERIYVLAQQPGV